MGLPTQSGKECTLKLKTKQSNQLLVPASKKKRKRMESKDTGSSRKKAIKDTNIWRLNNMLLNNQQIAEEIKKEIKICTEMNENENKTTQNLWDSAVLRGRFTAIQTYLKKQEKSQINNLSLHLKQLEKEEIKNPRVSRRKEIISSICPDHSVVRLDVNYREKTTKNTNILRLNNILLNNQQITEEIKKEIKICIETNENENSTTQNL